MSGPFRRRVDGACHRGGRWAAVVPVHIGHLDLLQGHLDHRATRWLLGRSGAAVATSRALGCWVATSIGPPRSPRPPGCSGALGCWVATSITAATGLLRGLGLLQGYPRNLRLRTQIVAAADRNHPMLKKPRVLRTMRGVTDVQRTIAVEPSAITTAPLIGTLHTDHTEILGRTGSRRGFVRASATAMGAA